MMPNDMKNWTAEDDNFQLLDPFTAMKALACIFVCAAIMEKWL